MLQSLSKKTKAYSASLHKRCLKGALVKYQSPQKHGLSDVSYASNTYFEWPTEKTSRSLPIKMRVKSILVDARDGYTRTIQIHLSDGKNDVYSPQFGEESSRHMKVVPVGSNITKVDFLSHYCGLRFTGEKGKITHSNSKR